MNNKFRRVQVVNFLASLSPPGLGFSAQKAYPIQCQEILHICSTNYYQWMGLVRARTNALKMKEEPMKHRQSILQLAVHVLRTSDFRRYRSFW